MKNNIKKLFVGFAVTLAAVVGIGFATPAKSEAACVVYESGYDYDTTTVYDNCGYAVYSETVIYY